MMKQDKAEVVVVGGGAVGTAVAAFLAKEGLDVALVERGEVAWGTSRRCDGHAVTYDSPPGYFSRFCKTGLDMFPEIQKELDCDIQFEPEGLGLLVDDEADLDTVKATFEGKKAEGVSVSFWDRDELKKHEPGVADHVLACLNFEGDAKLNPMRLCFGLAKLAEKRGAKIFTRTEVTGFETDAGKIRKVLTSRGGIACEKVVLATGVWTPALARLMDVDVPIRPRQGQILVTERCSGLAGKNYAEYGYLAAKGGKARRGVSPAMEEYGVAMVVEPSAEGTVLVGSSRRYVGMNTESDIAVMQAIALRVGMFFPAFLRTRVIRAYAGLRPATPDGKPILSPSSVQGLYIAAGHEGNGIGLSLISGKLMAEMMCGKEPSLELEPLRLERFQHPH